jgi:hypothetical protein
MCIVGDLISSKAGRLKSNPGSAHACSVRMELLFSNSRKIFFMNEYDGDGDGGNGARKTKEGTQRDPEEGGGFEDFLKHF